MIEIWKDIEGYEGLYQVSSEGRIKSLPKIVDRNGSKGAIQRRGEHISVGSGVKYLSVILTKDGKRKTYRVHRLVAQAFLPNPDNLPEVNHKDENPSNNSVSNLEWCTSKYNCNYGTHNQRMAKKLSKPVQQLTLDGVLLTIFPSAMEASRKTKICHVSIINACNGKYNTAGGYKWGYLN